MPQLAGEGRVTKRFRVAREGQTVDGRVLYRQDIQDMADSYNPDHYAGRINIEHLSGWSPEPPFNAYGDVVQVEAVDEGGKLCLYNTISALPSLIALNSKGQKIYPSIEFYTNFAGSGKAYQVGLALTDTPNSLGTQPLKFSANPHAHRTVPHQEIFMTLGQQATDATPAQEPDSKGIIDSIKQLLSSAAKPKEPTQAETLSILGQGVQTALQGVQGLQQDISGLRQQLSSMASQQSTDNPQSAATSTPAPAETTQTHAPNPAQQDQVTLQALATQVSQLQQQLHTATSTPVNAAPAAGGGTTHENDY